MWVSVQERLPDDDTTVLVYGPNSSEPVWFGYYDGHDWSGVSGESDTVTHWAPMPEGPK